MRGASILCAASLALAFAACSGGSGGGGSSGVDVTFEVFKGGQDVPCATAPEIQEVNVTVFASDGVSVRAGYPKKAECSSGTLHLTALPDGEHILDIAARGPLAGDDRALLFHARSTFSTPGTDSVQVSLKPEVAYLSVGWSFGTSDLLPCTIEVGEVEVLVSTGTTQGASFQGRFPCMNTPIVVPMPLPLLRYTIQIDAYSSEEFILFSGTAVRALERGDNDVTVMLEAMGGRLNFDWVFSVGGAMIRPCDDPRVGVPRVTATVKSLEGGTSVATDTFDCTVPRPHAFLVQRYRPGRQLEISLVGEGEERFIGIERITMPMGDHYDDPPLVMLPVGTATVSINIRTSTCSDLMIDGVSVGVYDATQPMGSMPVTTKDLAAAERTAVVSDLPFGPYDVEVALIRGGDRLCTVRERRVVDMRRSVWDPFVL